MPKEKEIPPPEGHMHPSEEFVVERTRYATNVPTRTGEMTPTEAFKEFQKRADDFTSQFTSQLKDEFTFVSEHGAPPSISKYQQIFEQGIKIYQERLGRMKDEYLETVARQTGFTKEEVDALKTQIEEFLPKTQLDSASRLGDSMMAGYLKDILEKGAQRRLERACLKLAKKVKMDAKSPEAYQKFIEEITDSSPAKADIKELVRKAVRSGSANEIFADMEKGALGFGEAVFDAIEFGRKYGFNADYAYPGATIRESIRNIYRLRAYELGMRISKAISTDPFVFNEMPFAKFIEWEQSGVERGFLKRMRVRTYGLIAAGVAATALAYYLFSGGGEKEKKKRTVLPSKMRLHTQVGTIEGILYADVTSQQNRKAIEEAIMNAVPDKGPNSVPRKHIKTKEGGKDVLKLAEDDARVRLARLFVALPPMLKTRVIAGDEELGGLPGFFEVLAELRNLPPKKASDKLIASTAYEIAYSVKAGSRREFAKDVVEDVRGQKGEINLSRLLESPPQKYHQAMTDGWRKRVFEPFVDREFPVEDSRLQGLCMEIRVRHVGTEAGAKLGKVQKPYTKAEQETLARFLAEYYSAGGGPSVPKDFDADLEAVDLLREKGMSMENIGVLFTAIPKIREEASLSHTAQDMRKDAALAGSLKDRGFGAKGIQDVFASLYLVQEEDWEEAIDKSGIRPRMARDTVADAFRNTVSRYRGLASEAFYNEVPKEIKSVLDDLQINQSDLAKKMKLSENSTRFRDLVSTLGHFALKWQTEKGAVTRDMLYNKLYPLLEKMKDSAYLVSLPPQEKAVLLYELFVQVPDVQWKREVETTRKRRRGRRRVTRTSTETGSARAFALEHLDAVMKSCVGGYVDGYVEDNLEGYTQQQREDGIRVTPTEARRNLRLRALDSAFGEGGLAPMRPAEEDAGVPSAEPLTELGAKVFTSASSVVDALALELEAYSAQMKREQK